MTAPSFSEKVYTFTRENTLISKGSTVIVGVSGGADSMALLHLLHTWEDWALTLVAVHIHHGLRGEEADRDEALVRAYCAEHAIEYVCEHVDVRALAVEQSLGEEEAGRQARYAIFDRVRNERAAQVIATAHHADDAAETMLMHIVRGCGIGGLCGIPAKRGCVVRPLLSCTRAEIVAYCEQHAIPYALDSTNTDTAYTRNCVRHRLLPLLREMNPSVDTALARLCASAAQDERFFAALAEQVLADAQLADGSLDRARLLAQEKSVRVRVWKALLLKNGCESYTERHIDALETVLSVGRGMVYLTGGCHVCVSVDRIKLFVQPQENEDLCIPVDSLPMRFVFDGHEHCLQLMSYEEMTSLQNVHKKFFKYAIDCDRIQGGLTVRCRRDGDRFHPVGRRVGKSLKSLFQELRIPTYYRDKVLLLCDEDGIVLMSGVSCDSRVCPNDSTKHFLVWLTDGEPSYTLNALWDGAVHGTEPIESKE